MQNTGTWNSDEAIFYFLVFISPICLYFLGGFISIILRAFPQQQTSQISFTKLVGEKEAWQAVKDRCLEDAINGDYRARDWLTKNCYGSTSFTSKPKPKPKTQPKKQETTSPEIVDEAIAGLASLGYKKSEARRLVNKLAVSKVYKKSEDLLTEIISTA